MSLLICIVFAVVIIWSISWLRVFQHIIFDIKAMVNPNIAPYGLDDILSHFYILIIDILLMVLIFLIIRKSNFLFKMINMSSMFALIGFYYISAVSYNSGILGPIIFQFTYTILFIFIIGLIWKVLYLYFKIAKNKGWIDFK